MDEYSGGRNYSCGGFLTTLENGWFYIMKFQGIGIHVMHRI